MTTKQVGDAAERLAVEALVRLGYRIVDRNYRIKQGEIDVVAEDGKTLVFVEVRSRGRSDFGTPEETISATKRRRIARAAEHWLMVKKMVDRICRFDVVAIDGANVRVYKDAFRLE